MPTFSDSSIHEDEHDIIADYENQESDGEQGNARVDGDVGSENDENNDDTGTKRRIDPTAAKHVVRNPIPKLNTERLKGPKGIHTIEKYFEGFKFHGKGHEKTDLDRIMKRMEHWGHRLFPKLDFDDFLEKVETLGTKKDLQVFIWKYRQDKLPPDGCSIINDAMDVEEEEDQGEPFDEFDRLIAEQIQKQKQVTTQHDSSIASGSMDNTVNVSTSETAFDQLTSRQNTQNTQPRKENNNPSQLSDEVKERIERNRQQAIQRKLARQAALREEANRKKLDETNSAPVLEPENSSKNDLSNKTQDLNVTNPDNS